MFELLTTSIYNAQRNSIGYFTHADGYGECAATESFKEIMMPDLQTLELSCLKGKPKMT